MLFRSAQGRGETPGPPTEDHLVAGPPPQLLHLPPFAPGTGTSAGRRSPCSRIAGNLAALPCRRQVGERGRLTPPSKPVVGAPPGVGQSHLGELLPRPVYPPASPACEQEEGEDLAGGAPCQRAKARPARNKWRRTQRGSPPPSESVFTSMCFLRIRRLRPSCSASPRAYLMPCA